MRGLRCLGSQSESFQAAPRGWKSGAHAFNVIFLEKSPTLSVSGSQFIKLVL